MAAIHKALADNDAAALRRAAHTLKASIGYFSGPAFAEVQQLEQFGPEEWPAAARAVLDALDRHLEELLQALRKYQPAMA